jgi:hypothetical protein
MNKFVTFLLIVIPFGLMFYSILKIYKIICVDWIILSDKNYLEVICDISELIGELKYAIGFTLIMV